MEYAKQSQESDGKGLPPTPYCSGCGSSMCKTGADRCSRQRKCERLELVTELIFEDLNAQVEESSSILMPGLGNPDGDPNPASEEAGRPGSWIYKTAKLRLNDFRRLALRQLAHMASNRGRTMGEHKGRVMKRGCLEEPGTGTFD